MSASSALAGWRRVSVPSRGEQGLEQRSGIGEPYAFAFEHPGHASDERVRVLLRKRGEQLDEAPVRQDRRKDLRVHDLAGHHDFGDALLLEDIDQLSELPERDPVAARGQRFHFLRGFLFDRDDHDFVPQLARGFEREDGEASVAGDQPVSHFTTPRLEACMNAISSSSSGKGSISASNALDGLRGVEAGAGRAGGRPCAARRARAPGSRGARAR